MRAGLGPTAGRAEPRVGEGDVDRGDGGGGPGTAVVAAKVAGGKQRRAGRPSTGRPGLAAGAAGRRAARAPAGRQRVAVGTISYVSVPPPSVPHARPRAMSAEIAWTPGSGSVGAHRRVGVSALHLVV